ncbi:protein Mp3R-MYB4 [Marchantia polymorpha subsp. ruderalis]|nr:hypothetical protein AXG93_3309s1360 [Marchantia polymorpha subsp. ruderalis]PTQ29956.1 hypothetical protein MARPO_0132s0031 [Marchantia polymorpha]PTQ29957.1 hypothetical protein MARPO_0132s0031 [Marchantia polymorpha]BBN08227.1 hypothetical protein Mp_4g09880 [Marchantia polymorpha subsp. ruderalis]BBN08228.1 hypothetical protein Mp_4g09880 [Marchantia polymorpha subsp. ruderalis]|eukprot:PTQ29956.1 hypothetical protein MARPO_0132s0031 [Marchantia polymorpha]
MRKRVERWTPEEDELLQEAVVQYKAKNWRLVAKAVPNRTEIQCLQRWQKVLNPAIVKGYWTKEEDQKMLELVGMLGTKRWAAVARSLPGRIGKQCRERWYNQLDPSIKRDPWTEVEDMRLFLAHKRFGSKWSQICSILPGRSENGVKNRWNTHIKKKAFILEEYCRMLNNQQNPSQNEELLGNEAAKKDLLSILE